MNRIVLSIASLAIGFGLGYLAGFSSSRQPAARPAELRSFYYRLNDSTVVRHTIRGSADSLQHGIDTIPLLPSIL